MLATIYIEVDDFCKNYHEKIEKVIACIPFFKKLFEKRRIRKSVTMGEIISVLIYYHYSGYKNFKVYYQNYVAKYLIKEFPDLPTYSRFVWWIPLALIPLAMFCSHRCLQSRRTGVYFIDSTKIGACDNHRVHQNKVFKGFASWGKTSMGWFWGFKLHLVINQYGEIMKGYHSIVVQFYYSAPYAFFV